MDELKSCPFCGGKPKLNNQNPYTTPFVECTACGADAYVEFWNSRQVDQALENASKILANFQGEGLRTKQEEWEACYAMLFKQMNDLVISSVRKVTVLTDALKYMVDAFCGVPQMASMGFDSPPEAATQTDHEQFMALHAAAQALSEVVEENDAG